MGKGEGTEPGTGTGVMGALEGWPCRTGRRSRGSGSGTRSLGQNHRMDSGEGPQGRPDPTAQVCTPFLGDSGGQSVQDGGREGLPVLHCILWVAPA